MAVCPNQGTHARSPAPKPRRVQRARTLGIALILTEAIRQGGVHPDPAPNSDSHVSGLRVSLSGCTLTDNLRAQARKCLWLQWAFLFGREGQKWVTFCNYRLAAMSARVGCPATQAAYPGSR
jgi:hypothetical protein